MKEEVKTQVTSEEMEMCIYCGEKTDIPRSMPVDLRTYYVEGAGQLCKKCYDKVYGKEE